MMADYLLHVDATASCPNQGRISIISSNTRVKVSGKAVATLNDTYIIEGCTFTLLNGTSHPCVKVQWLRPAIRVSVNGQRVILQGSTGLCQSADQAPQGVPTVTITQKRVKGT